MKAVVYNGIRDVEMKDIEAPTCSDEHVLIDVEACGICGTDLHLYREGWGVDMITQSYPEGRVPGHEFAGTISAVGNKVHDYKIGDRVIAIGSFGGMAEQVAVHATPLTLYRIPDEVSMQEAATAEPLSNAFHVARRSQPKSGENVVVFGMGIIGIGLVQAYRALSVDLDKLIVIDTSNFRLAAAKEAGADYCLNPRECDVVEEVVRICGKRLAPFGLGEFPAVDIVCDCVGYIRSSEGPPVLQQALDIIGRDGRILCFGVFEDDVTLSLNALVIRQPQLSGVAGLNPEDVSDALDFMAKGRIDRDPFITQKFAIDEVEDAFETQVNYSESIKVVLLPQQTARTPRA